MLKGNIELEKCVQPRVDLVVHHMLEPLVVGGAQEDLGVHLPSRVAGVHHLVYNVNLKAIQHSRPYYFQFKVKS